MRVAALDAVDVSAVAVIVTAPPAGGMLIGGVYAPLAEMVPVPAAPPAIPFTAHVTAESPLPPTAAASCTDDPMRTWSMPVMTTCEEGAGEEAVCTVLTEQPSSRVAMIPDASTPERVAGKQRARRKRVRPKLPPRGFSLAIYLTSDI